MKELKPLICPRCGGKVNRGTYACEYCNTAFDKPEKEDLTVRLVELRMPVKEYGIKCKIPFYELTAARRRGNTEWIIRKKFAEEIAEKIADDINIRQDFDDGSFDPLDPLANCATFTGKIYIGMVNGE